MRNNRLWAGACVYNPVNVLCIPQSQNNVLGVSILVVFKIQSSRLRTLYVYTLRKNKTAFLMKWKANKRQANDCQVHVHTIHTSTQWQVSIILSLSTTSCLVFLFGWTNLFLTGMCLTWHSNPVLYNIMHIQDNCTCTYTYLYILHELKCTCTSSGLNQQGVRCFSIKEGKLAYETILHTSCSMWINNASWTLYCAGVYVHVYV